MGMFLALAGAVGPLGLATGGILADLTGRQIPATFVTLGSAAVVFVMISASRRPFREFLAADTEAESRRP